MLLLGGFHGSFDIIPKWYILFNACDCQGGACGCKMIGHAKQQAPKPQAILKAWLSFKEVVGVTSVRTEADYRRARATIESLLDQVGDDETHPLADVLAYLGDQVKAYEDAKFPIPQSQPHEVLRFLMDQHGLKQEDLADCAPQSRISDILNRRRAISKEIAKRLARRFNVRVDLFL
ncbi:MAG: helix-turn-helix domain-containing protein [Arenimonas sp.]|jgi:HTH-type transcriptional regulator/antitoxin HigA